MGSSMAGFVFPKPVAKLILTRCPDQTIFALMLRYLDLQGFRESRTQLFNELERRYGQNVLPNADGLPKDTVQDHLTYCLAHLGTVEVGQQDIAAEEGAALPPKQTTPSAEVGVAKEEDQPKVQESGPAPDSAPPPSAVQDIEPDQAAPEDPPSQTSVPPPQPADISTSHARGPAGSHAEQNSHAASVGKEGSPAGMESPAPDPSEEKEVQAASRASPLESGEAVSSGNDEGGSPRAGDAAAKPYGAAAPVNGPADLLADEVDYEDDEEEDEEEEEEERPDENKEEGETAGPSAVENVAEGAAVGGENPAQSDRRRDERKEGRSSRRSPEPPSRRRSDGARSPRGKGGRRDRGGPHRPRDGNPASREARREAGRIRKARELERLAAARRARSPPRDWTSSDRMWHGGAPSPAGYRGNKNRDRDHLPSGAFFPGPSRDRDFPPPISNMPPHGPPYSPMGGMKSDAFRSDGRRPLSRSPQDTRPQGTFRGNDSGRDPFPPPPPRRMDRHGGGSASQPDRKRGMGTAIAREIQRGDGRDLGGRHDSKFDKEDRAGYMVHPSKKPRI